jgi:hypothetical protein
MPQAQFVSDILSQQMPASRATDVSSIPNPESDPNEVPLPNPESDPNEVPLTAPMGGKPKCTMPENKSKEA